MESKKTKHTRVGVVGLGFVGLPLALLLNKKGFHVTGIDINDKKINSLVKGTSYIDDIPNESIKNALDSGKFTVTKNYESVQSLDAIIICVPTPLTKYKTPDLSYIQDVAYNLYPRLTKGQLVILESSTFPGTTKEILKPILEKSNLRVGVDIFLCYSPERIDPGNKDTEVEAVPKVISGVTKACSSKIEELYSQIFNHTVSVSSTEVAEFSKLLENSFRYVNISFINEMALLSDGLNIDLWEVIDAASTKPYGFTPFYPGPGIGGHCIPVDPIYLSWKAKQAGIQTNFIDLSDRINTQLTEYLTSQLIKNLSVQNLQNKNILLYGLAYKKDISDYRESPSISIMKELLEMGANVSFHDPFVSKIDINGQEFQSVELTKDTLQQNDCIVILTDHSEIPLDLIIENSSLIYDTRNITKNYKEKRNIIRFGSGSL
ncbi:nucleotide sugar dehydrogenase [Oceanobacillus salinisoli]|uniref:nucleotide sugar dehydrogenase n=1 Tax=Oceanobacillus salinisoli TaxID=2678611 RepID=UPI0012E30C3A|nr:nucleotide sugar dehydrogenase [Oceanobacillus salinisoli]